MKKHLLTKIIVGVSLVILAACIIIIISNLKGCNERTAGYEETVIYPTEVESKEAYVSPIDWDELADQNKDIYAWLYIPDTKISYPILQRELDDTYYLTRDADENYYYGGAIMSESQYNSKDFEDPVNILYGHNMRSGAMFGTLQSTFPSSEGFSSHRDIIVYLPDKELHYKVWAALPFGNEHLMVSYDRFEEKADIKNFVSDISKTRSLSGQMDSDMTVTEDDEFIILSTCLSGQSSSRFLVIGVLDEVIN